MPLTLGAVRGGRELRLTDEERSRHLHVIGASGTGKSKFLESIIRQDILSGRGLCLIDPHGTLADSIVEWCAARKIDRHRRIHVIDPKDQGWAAGFNPLRYDGEATIHARVDAMVETCATVWGGEDLNQTPLLATCLKLVFYALAVNDLTLVEATELTSSADPYAIRQRLTGRLPSHAHEEYWRDFSTLPRRDFEERFSSTRRRLLPFVSAPPIRRIVGQRQNALDFKRIMDEGDIVIVNLAMQESLSDKSARLLGALITSELRLCAMTRDKVTALRKPFSLYIDECYDYLTGDVQKMLDQTRKFGLHVILAHQRLSQLRTHSEDTYSAVMAGGQTKIVFGGMEDEEAEVMAKQVYRSTFNLERPKHVLDKPVVVDEVPYWLESESWTDSESLTQSHSDSSSWGGSSANADSLSTSFGPMSVMPLGYVRTAGDTTGDSFGETSTDGWAHTQGSARSQGRSQTLKPVRVTMPTAVYSLDEQLHLAIVKLRELPNQAAIVKRRGHQPVRIRPATVKPVLARQAMTDGFVEATRTKSVYISSSAHAETEIANRYASLRGEQPKTQAEAVEVETFWSE